MPLAEEEIMRQLMSTFKGEADEHLGALTKLLLQLEKADGGDNRQDLLEEVFRAAHSLKGAARAVEAGAIEMAAHGMETVLAAAKRNELALTSTHFDLLCEALDCISAALKCLATGETPIDNPDLLARLEKSVGDSPAAGAPAENGPAPVDPRIGLDLRGNAGDRRKATNKGVEEMVRVSTRKLDALMTHVEELLVSKIRTEQRVAELKDLRGALQEWQKSWLKTRGVYERLRRQPQPESKELIAFLGQNQDNLKDFWAGINDLLQSFTKDSLRMSLVTEDLQEDIRRVRMLPVASLFESYSRMVRDLARQQNKKINLVVSGAETELDKKLIEGIKDPLMHIIRNSVDHGIETPQARRDAGKPETGTIWLTASQHGNTIQIEVEDDGGGINVDKIKTVAIEKGIISTSAAKTFSDEDAADLIFQSGFSTAARVTSVSGRGVGMDVVRTNIENLRGLVHVSPRALGGTRVACSLPLTLSTSRVLLVQAEGETFAVPTSTVERIIRIDRSEIFTVGNKEAIQVAGRSLSLVRVADVLELPQAESAPAPHKIPIIILGAAEKRVAFSVDALLGETEIVVKALGKMMSRVRNVSGATILGNGKVVMILNVADMIKSAKHARRKGAMGGFEKDARREKEGAEVSILVVDDSITTLIMEKNILESAGYSVALANDGVEAFEALNRGRFDVVVSDVDMPRMNGFELTTKVKQSDEFKNLPVILVTSLDSAADKERGLECGADAYIIKHSFDQKNLLETIEQLV